MDNDKIGGDSSTNNYLDFNESYISTYTTPYTCKKINKQGDLGEWVLCLAKLCFQITYQHFLLLDL